ncbi:MAG: AAA family ATPase, partial [Candidatus Rokuibacteriota bacterium]
FSLIKVSLHQSYFRIGVRMARGPGGASATGIYNGRKPGGRAMGEVGTSGSDPRPSEHRFLTIEFIDLVGFTDLAEQLDPEELGLLLRRYQRLALTTMERFGGFVAQAFGDGLLVYFGYPAAHGNDAERALLAAFALLQGLRDLDTTVHGRTMPKLEARIGVHSGLVMIAQELVTGPGTSGYGAVGEAVNLSNRLQGEVPSGGIAISQETASIVEGLFECRPLGLKAIKGLSRKVEVYQVVRPLPDTKRSESRVRRGAARMVGREGAIERILARWQVAREGARCQTVAVVGDAGLGKTRLMLELSSRPEFADATLVQGQCHELFASTPLYPIRVFLRGRAGLTADDEESVRLDKIAAYLVEIGRDTQENRELIATLRGVGAPDRGAAPAATPQLLKQKQYQLIGSIFDQAARAHPVVLWIDDAHWLDPSSAELLRDVVVASTKVPVLAVLTMRPFPKGPALPEIDETIPLEHLGMQDCLELARSVPGAGGLSEEMVVKAVEAAEGVPFFLEQLVISLLDEQARGPAPHRRLSGVPLMLAELMSERLDRRPGARRIAQAAACIGGAFTLDFLLALLEDEAQVRERLEALVEAEILLPKRVGAEIRYEFRHALLQRMAHESMVQTERRAMHAHIVAVLRNPAVGEPAIPEVLAHHLTEAGAFPEAVGAWLRAGVAADRRSAHVEAVEHIRNGLRLLDKIPDPGSRRQFELNLQASMMGSLLASQSATSPELAACCERGLQLCEEGAAVPMAFPFAFGQFTFVNCRGRTGEAISLARQFISRAEHGGFESERVIGHRMLGQALLAKGDTAGAKAALERSMALYVPARDAATTHLYGQNTEVHTKSLLSVTYLCLGDVDIAIETGLDALRAADAIRHPHSTAIPMVYVGGWLFWLCGAAEQMLTVGKSLLALAEQHRLYGFRAHAAAFIGWALCQGGNPEAGMSMIAKAIAAFDSVQFRLSTAGHVANLADAQRRAGRLAEAAVTCERAMELMPEGCQWLEAELRRVHALVAAELAPGERDHAETLFRGAVSCAQEYRFPVLERRCLLSLARFLTASGRPDASVESRLGELSHLADLDRRVARAMQGFSHV